MKLEQYLRKKIAGVTNIDNEVNEQKLIISVSISQNITLENKINKQ